MSDVRNSVASDVAFSSAVKAAQTLRNSRATYERMEEHGSWPVDLSPDLVRFIESRRSAFLSTASADGQPYIQHRGGPAGFLKVLDRRTIGFADYAGNRQYITIGNLSENPKAHLFLIDYDLRQRVKLWGRMRVVEGDQELMARLSPSDYRARVERAMLFTVEAWDVNCPQHIPHLVAPEIVQDAIAERDMKIAALEREIDALKNQMERPV
ncbi:pyridoxamine 5'-phosphate oxidase family protein [Rhizobium sp. SL86]|uniref:pyridoxamine 5'-phosphate oxidase family protein n=1 Tax=Rhizobium sp. SL86 TaxID=2995148 RepID=UPI002276ED54|nr:pyridoxamine 5'-phosphate oxidase family protein [Rhizobium sp. SL86]MCY1666698.1 pyridoxamine 5'-phosphate oxidase family protein [Rhizobium sp. SL86]